MSKILGVRHICLKAAGRTARAAKITVEPADKVPGPGCPVRIAFCRGPLGESIEFFQER